MPFTALKGYSVQAAASNSGTWGAGNPGNDLNTGVMGILDAGLRWKEALQAGAMKLQYARMRRRAVLEEEAKRYALGEQERRVRDLAHEKSERVAVYARRIAAGKKP